MSDYQRTVIPVIEAAYDSMTAVEKTIADFFINNNERMDFAAKRVAQRLFVSEASLSLLPRSAVLRDTGSSCITTTAPLLKIKRSWTT